MSESTGHGWIRGFPYHVWLEYIWAQCNSCDTPFVAHHGNMAWMVRDSHVEYGHDWFEIGECPRCHGWGRPLNTVFKREGDHEVAGSTYAAAARKLRSVLETLEPTATVDDLVEALDGAPGPLAVVAAWLRETFTGREIAKMAVGAALGLVLQLLYATVTGADPVTEDDLRRILNEERQHQQQSPPPAPQAPDYEPQDDQHREEPDESGGGSDVDGGRDHGEDRQTR